MELMNLTTQPLVIYDAAGKKAICELPVSPLVITVDADYDEVGLVKDDVNASDGVGCAVVPVVRHRFRVRDGHLPPSVPGVTYVVGYATLQALRDSGCDRADVVAPDTSRGSAVRGPGGVILGVRRFRTV